MAVWRDVRGPQVSGGELDVAHARQRRRRGRDGRAGQPVGRIGVTGVPQRLPTREAEGVEGARRGERLHLRNRQACTTHDVDHVDEGTLGTGGDDALGVCRSDPLHLGEPEPHDFNAFQVSPDTRKLDTGAADLDAMAAGVGDEGLR